MHARKLAGSMVLATWLPAVAGLGAAAQDTRLIDAAPGGGLDEGVIALLEQGAAADTRQADGAGALHWGPPTGTMRRWPTRSFGPAPPSTRRTTRRHPALAGLPQRQRDDGRDPAGGRRRRERRAALGRDGADDRVPHRVGGGGASARVPRRRPERPRAHAGADGADVGGGPAASRRPWRRWPRSGRDVHARSAPRPRRIHTRTAGFNPAGVLDVVQGGNTPILFAARQGSLDAAGHLVAAGADVNDIAASGTSALVVAAHSGHTALARFLLDPGRRPERGRGRLLRPARRHQRGDETLAAALLARGADPNAPVRRGSPGRRNSPDYVLEHDVIGATAFWLAAHFAEPGVMRALADNGADPRIVPGGRHDAPDGGGSRPPPPGTGTGRESGRGRASRAGSGQGWRSTRGATSTRGDAAGNTTLHTAASRRLDTVGPVAGGQRRRPARLERPGADTAGAGRGARGR